MDKKIVRDVLIVIFSFVWSSSAIGQIQEESVDSFLDETDFINTLDDKANALQSRLEIGCERTFVNIGVNSDCYNDLIKETSAYLILSNEVAKILDLNLREISARLEIDKSNLEHRISITEGDLGNIQTDFLQNLVDQNDEFEDLGISVVNLEDSHQKIIETYDIQKALIEKIDSDILRHQTELNQLRSILISIGFQESDWDKIPTKDQLNELQILIDLNVNTLSDLDIRVSEIEQNLVRFPNSIVSNDAFDAYQENQNTKLFSITSQLEENSNKIDVIEISLGSDIAQVNNTLTNTLDSLELGLDEVEKKNTAISNKLTEALRNQARYITINNTDLSKNNSSYIETLNNINNTVNPNEKIYAILMKYDREIYSREFFDICIWLVDSAEVNLEEEYSKLYNCKSIEEDRKPYVVTSAIEAELPNIESLASNNIEIYSADAHIRSSEIKKGHYIFSLALEGQKLHALTLSSPSYGYIDTFFLEAAKGHNVFYIFDLLWHYFMKATVWVIAIGTLLLPNITWVYKILISKPLKILWTLLIRLPFVGVRFEYVQKQFSKWRSSDSGEQDKSLDRELKAHALRWLKKNSSR